MNRITMNDTIIKTKKQEMDFLRFFNKLGYDLVDLNVVETFNWGSITLDDQKMMDKRHSWTDGGVLHALRSDWTNSIVRYRKQYELEAEKIAYAGMVYKKSGTIHQMGVETFTSDIAAQQEVLSDVLAFMTEHLKKNISIAVISHNKLLKKLLTKDQMEDPMIHRLVSERNKDALSHALSKDHPVIGLMQVRPEDQLEYIAGRFPELAQEIEDLKVWEDKLRKLSIENVYIDTLVMPRQSYYRGIFIQLYQKNETEPQASGGQYTSSSKAFGMGING
ncbi:MAG: ATP phosphoribosyltransferase regulatory subunit [Youngiibacter sp.]|nr:ATP phosphoribosyltransferase regulatory subunit [Youngiibacter sp.]